MQTWTTQQTCSFMDVSAWAVPHISCCGWALVRTARPPGMDCPSLPPNELPIPLTRRRTSAAGGESLEEAFENVALCMFNYMTPLAGIAVDESLTRWAAGCPAGPPGAALSMVSTPMHAWVKSISTQSHAVAQHQAEPAGEHKLRALAAGCTRDARSPVLTPPPSAQDL